MALKVGEYRLPDGISKTMVEPFTQYSTAGAEALAKAMGQAGAAIGGGVGNMMERGREDAKNASLAELGGMIGGGDFGAASQRAFELGQPDLGMKLATQGYQVGQQKTADEELTKLLGPMGGGSSPTTGSGNVTTNPSAAPTPEGGPKKTNDHTSYRLDDTQRAEMASAIRSTADKIGVDPQHLAAIMSFETGGTLDPWKAGPTTKWGQHMGLIQWGEPQRQQYGVSRDTSITDQVAAAGKYLQDHGVKPGMGLPNIYSAVLHGNAASGLDVRDQNGTSANSGAANMMRTAHINALANLERGLNLGGQQAPAPIADILARRDAPPAANLAPQGQPAPIGANGATPLAQLIGAQRGQAEQQPQDGEPIAPYKTASLGFAPPPGGDAVRPGAIVGTGDAEKVAALAAELKAKSNGAMPGTSPNPRLPDGSFQYKSTVGPGDAERFGNSPLASNDGGIDLATAFAAMPENVRPQDRIMPPAGQPLQSGAVVDMPNGQGKFVAQPDLSMSPVTPPTNQRAPGNVVAGDNVMPRQLQTQQQQPQQQPAFDQNAYDALTRRQESILRAMGSQAFANASPGGQARVKSELEITKNQLARMDAMRGDPAYKHSQEVQMREADGRRYGLKDQDLNQYVLTGHLPEGGGNKIAADAAARKQLIIDQGGDPTDGASRQFILTGKFPREDQAPLTATDKKAILEADDAINSTQSYIKALQEAQKLSHQSLGFPGAGVVAKAGALIGNQSSINTQDLDNLVTQNALNQLKSTFGTAPTEGERQILLQMQGSASMPDAVRQRIYSRALEFAQERLTKNQQRANELRGGDFYKPQGGASQGGQQRAPQDGQQQPTTQQRQPGTKLNAPDSSIQLFARDAIRNGVPLAEIRKRMVGMGVNPSFLDQGE
jgi:hypothetical protein